jgi:hypothetical protein
MPFMDESEVLVHGERVRVRANQIIAWVSLGLQRLLEPNPTALPFPAILDTGHTHSFAIQERHLVDWAGIQPESLAVLGAARERGQRVLLHAANIWVHPNERNRRSQLARRPPYLLEALSGIAVYRSGDFPRLPLLGLRAIVENDLVLKVHGRDGFAILRTPFRWWPFS